MFITNEDTIVALQQAQMIVNDLEGEDVIYWTAFSACCLDFTIVGLAMEWQQSLAAEALMASAAGRTFRLPEDFKAFVTERAILGVEVLKSAEL